jgi:hypothetical protein
MSTIKSADTIYIAFSASSANYHASQIISAWIRKINPSVNVLFVDTDDWTYKCAETAAKNIKFAAHISDEKLKQLATPAQIDRYWGFNYINNRNVIIGRLFDKLGIDRNVIIDGDEVMVPLPSFSAIQLLYYMDSVGEEGVEEGRLAYRTCRDWRGTGRYDAKPGVEREVYDGKIFVGFIDRIQLFVEDKVNFASHMADAISDLVKMGLLDRRKELDPGDVSARSQRNKSRNFVSLSENGRKFLQALHPDCQDFDLPFRLQEWQKLPSEEARKKIDKYLLTWFGRQKRFLDKK